MLVVAIDKTMDFHAWHLFTGVLSWKKQFSLFETFFPVGPLEFSGAIPISRIIDVSYLALKKIFF